METFKTIYSIARMLDKKQNGLYNRNKTRIKMVKKYYTEALDSEPFSEK